MSDRTRIKEGDAISLQIRAVVESITKYSRSDTVSRFTGITFVGGEPREDGTPERFTLEIPDGVGEVNLLREGPDRG